VDFTTKLFNGLAALNLKQTSELRPLTQSEKNLLEQTEAKAGETLPQMESYIKELKERKWSL
jgi:hypothetical protein